MKRKLYVTRDVCPASADENAETEVTIWQGRPRSRRGTWFGSERAHAALDLSAADWNAACDLRLAPGDCLEVVGKIQIEVKGKKHETD